MKKDVYDLSKPQESIWLTEQYFKNTNINRIITVADFSEKFDTINFDFLKLAINNVIMHNDAFQIRLFLDNGSPKEYFCEYSEVNISIVEISSVDDFLADDSKRENVFNLLNSPLYEFKLYRILGTNTGGIIANFHHIICDSFSTSICIKQISECYNSLITTGNLPNLNPDNYSYIQYINSENEYKKSNKFEKDMLFWNNKFKTIPEIATIYSSKIADTNASCNGNRITYSLEKDLVAKINNLCEKLNVSPYNFFMSVFGVYISKVSRLNDFVIGTPILNRTNYREKNTFGMFVSTIPFRLTLDDSLTFSSYITGISRDTMSMLRHQKYSYGYIIEKLREKDSSIPNLYNIMLSYQITKASDFSSDYTTDWCFNHCTNNDLDIHIYDLNDEKLLNISYDYNSNKYAKEEIETIHPRILNIINQVLNDSEIILQKIDIATPEEKSQILNNFNNTKSPYPKNRSVISLFEEQVLLTPNAPALFFENKTLTYKELNEKANSLANFLNDKKILPGDTVALFLDKSLESIIAIIATLKVGACYLPIDTAYPDERILFMIKDAKSKICLTTSNLTHKLNLNIRKFTIDLDSEIYKSNSNFKSIETKLNDIAYIMYTSGSTGTPKGVIIPNRAIVRLVKNTNFITFSKGDRILQTGSIAFDASTFEIWGSLLNGLELYILKKSDLLNPEYFSNYIRNNRISSLFLTTSLFNKYAEIDPGMFKPLKYLLVGGEALSFKHIKAVHDENPNVNIVNGYGPTENTTFSCYFNISDLSSGFIPVGFPLANSTCYIVSTSQTLQPSYVPGELWVGGDRCFFRIFK